MPFGRKVQEDALVKSARRCCVCHVFTGREAEVQHITPESENGPNAIDNAIVLCQRCHGEAGHYDTQHPRGNKYSREELRRHRDLWWGTCERASGFSVPEDPISISPPTITLIDSHRQTQGEFAVSNRSNDPYWQVWLRLTFRPDPINLADMEIAITERSPQGARAKRAGDLSVQGLHVITHDKSGNQLRFFMIDRLRPGQYVYLIARLPIETRPIKNLQLCLDLWSFGSSPLALSFGEGSATLPIEFPVPLWRWRESKVWFEFSYPLEDS